MWGGQDVPGSDEQAVGDGGLSPFAAPADGDASEQRRGRAPEDALDTACGLYLGDPTAWA